MLLVKNVLVYGVRNITKKYREKTTKKSILYREKNKDKLKRNRKTIDTCTEVIQDLYNQINTLTEIVKSTTLVA